ncbi:hypothetical protein QQF64_013479 [Cirrhinus molitorella]|uniref:Uncharacterized protein n=1 Tax=Cirrhinus molitorella TaxID=172907 RepID=A0ABR3LRD0_9TELE
MEMVLVLSKRRMSTMRKKHRKRSTFEKYVRPDSGAMWQRRHLHGVFSKLANGRLAGRSAVLTPNNKPWSWRRSSSTVYKMSLTQERRLDISRSVHLTDRQVGFPESPYENGENDPRKENLRNL